MLSSSADYYLGGSISKSKKQCQKPLNQNCPISFAGRCAGTSKYLESGHKLN